jgi:centromeric protein E
VENEGCFLFHVQPRVCFVFTLLFTVAVRLRPMQTSAQSKDHYHHHHHHHGWTVQEADHQIVQKGVTVRKVVGRTVFPMDAVFSESTSTRTVYERSVQPIVQKVFAGMHGTVLAYGQTGSGKTYTMQGGDENQDGIISMAATDLFNMIHNAGPEQESTVRVSYYEVYNEEIRDLLVEPRSVSPAAAADARSQKQHAVAAGCFRRINGHTSGASGSSSTVSSKAGQRLLPALTIRETPDGNVFVNACQGTVTCAQDVLRLLHKGNCNRACAATDANAQSSRSHAIFKLTLETRIAHDVLNDMRPISMEQADVAVLGTKRVSSINLVDLAGSEKEGRHHNTGGAKTAAAARRLEGGKINQSLLALSRVIHSLSLPDKKRPKFICYRDSKLTRILQPSLSGSACVAILCCASLARSDLEETRSTLKFASSAKQIEIKATVNEVAGEGQDASTAAAAAAMEIAKLQRELFEVKNELAILQELFLMQRPKQQEETTTRTSSCAKACPVCVGCIETTGSSTTEDCSTTHDDTNSTTTSHSDKWPLSNDDNVVDKAPCSMRDDKNHSRVVGDDGDSYSESDSTVNCNGRISPLSDNYDDTTTLLSLGDCCPAQSPRPLVVQVSWGSSIGSSSSSSSTSNRGQQQQQELVEKLYSDLQNARNELQKEKLVNLEELEERCLRLEEEMASRNDQERIVLAWFVLLCFGLYACGMKEICLSALIFLGLSLHFTAAAE